LQFRQLINSSSSSFSYYYF